MHTRIEVSGWREGDIFVRMWMDRGAKFRDDADIAQVTTQIKNEMAQRMMGEGEPRFRVTTRECD